jgi:alpha-ketoglutarate-dependent taurine dioxygenase
MLEELKQDQTIAAEVVYPGHNFLLAIESKRDGVPASTWAAANRGALKASILQYGGVLLRGFACDRLGFSDVAKALEPEQIDYRGGIGPRKMVAPEVYNSTDLPPQYSLAQHHEMAYNSYWPMQILFFCEQPPDEGGATTICDARQFYRRMSRAALARFDAGGLRYVRTYTKDTPYRSLEETFGTTDQATISEFCRRNGVQATWHAEDRLTLAQHAPAVRKHPQTGEPVFFNTLSVWHHACWLRHLSAFDEGTARAAQGEYWHDAVYGDGTPIEDSVALAVQHAYEAEQYEVRWQKSDIIYFDNMLVSHGRMPFSGRRSILASFRTPLQASSLSVS